MPTKRDSLVQNNAGALDWLLILGADAASIPIFGAPLASGLLGITKSFSEARDKHLALKLRRFIFQLGSADGEAVYKMQQRLENNEERVRIGGILIKTIEQIEDIQKVDVAGKMLKAFLEGHISKEELISSCHAITHVLYENILLLEKIGASAGPNEAAAQNLSAFGLLVQTGIDMASSTDITSGPMTYKRTALGDTILRHGLK